MKKKLIFIALAILVSFVSPKAEAAVYKNGDIILKLNNSFLIYSQQEMPIIKNDRILLPIRMIGDLMGSKIVWEHANKSITIQDNNKIIKMYIGKKEIEIEKEISTIDSPPVILNGTVFVPLRFITHALGVAADYHSDKRVVELQSEKLLKAESVAVIDEMSHKDDDFNGMIVPLSVKVKKNGEDQSLLVEVINYSDTTLKQYELHRNIVFYRNSSSAAFNGSKGESHESVLGYNKTDMKPNEKIIDEVPLIMNIEGDRLGKYKYILSNYFKIS